MRPLPAALKEIAGVVPASRLERPPVATVSCGIAAVDTLTGGLPRGALTEIYGAASSGRTSLMMSALAAATARAELCALIDATDCFDPQSAEAAGVELDRLLWIRCGGEESGGSLAARRENPTDIVLNGESAASRILAAKQRTGTIMPGAKVWYGRPPARSERKQIQSGGWLVASGEHDIPVNSPPAGSHGGYPRLRGESRRSATARWARPVEQALKAADLLLQSGGFGMVVIDFGDVPAEIAKRVPLTSWFRFRRAVENTPAVLLVIARESCAKTCASLVLEIEQGKSRSIPFAPRRVGMTNFGTKVDGTKPSHARVFAGLESTVEVVRSRLEAPVEERPGKKPPRSAQAEFKSRTEWDLSG